MDISIHTKFASSSEIKSDSNTLIFSLIECEFYNLDTEMVIFHAMPSVLQTAVSWTSHTYKSLVVKPGCTFKKRGDTNLALRVKRWSSLVTNQDPRDTSFGMQPTNISKFPVMWNLKKLCSLWKKWKKLNRASLNAPPIYESDNLGLKIVTPAQPPSRPPSPGLSASRSQKQTHLNPPIAPPAVPQGVQPSGSGQGSAIPEPPKPWYSLHATKERLAHQDQPSGDNINTILINMFQETPNSYQEALNSEDSDKWLAAS